MALGAEAVSGRTGRRVSQASARPGALDDAAGKLRRAPPTPAKRQGDERRSRRVAVRGLAAIVGLGARDAAVVVAAARVRRVVGPRREAGVVGAAVPEVEGQARVAVRAPLSRRPQRREAILAVGPARLGLVKADGARDASHAPASRVRARWTRRGARGLGAELDRAGRPRYRRRRTNKKSRPSHP